MQIYCQGQKNCPCSLYPVKMPPFWNASVKIPVPDTPLSTTFLLSSPGCSFGRKNKHLCLASSFCFDLSFHPPHDSAEVSRPPPCFCSKFSSMEAPHRGACGRSPKWTGIVYCLEGTEMMLTDAAPSAGALVSALTLPTVPMACLPHSFF